MGVILVNGYGDPVAMWGGGGGGGGKGGEGHLQQYARLHKRILTKCGGEGRGWRSNSDESDKP